MYAAEQYGAAQKKGDTHQECQMNDVEDLKDRDARKINERTFKALSEYTGDRTLHV